MNRHSIMRIIIEDAFGGRHERAINFQIDGNPTLGVKPPEPFLDNFDSAVHRMKARDKRKRCLVDIAANLAAQICERIEDAEGWHGQERKEKLEALGEFPPKGDMYL